MVVCRNRIMVSAVTLIGVTIIKAQEASSFRAHTNPQEDFPLADIRFLFSRCIPQMYYISQTHFVRPLSGAGFGGCQKILLFHLGNCLLSWSVSELGESQGQSGLDFYLQV